MRYEGLIEKITYQDITKTSPLAFIVWTFDDFKVIDWNKSAERIFGWKKGEVLDKNFFCFLIPKSAENKVKKVIEAIKAEKVLTYSLNDNLTKDGRIIINEWHNIPLKDRRGKINLVISMAHDVTERFQKEKELEESKKRLHSLVESMPNAIVIANEKGNIIYWNRSAEKIFGYSKNEIVGKKVTIIIPKEFRKAFEEGFKKAVFLKHPTKEAIEVPALRKDGRQIFIEWSLSNWRYKKRLFFAAIGKDITKRKKIEEKLRQSEEKYQRLVESASDGVCVVQDEKLVYVNTQLAKMWGGSVEELVGKQFTELVPPDEVPYLVERYKKRLKGEKTPQRYELVLKGKDGREFYVDVSANLMIYEDKPADLIIVRDITERKKQEEKIKRLYSLQKAVREINQILLRIKEIGTEPELFRKICRILVEEIEDFKFSWIGFLEKETFRVKPVAYAGFEKGYLSSVEVRWDKSEYDMGPTGMAVKERRPFVVNDIENDPRYSLWREEALKRGYRSSIVVPIVDEDKLFGTLTIYSSKKGAFGEEEVKFLGGAAGDIIIGIRSLRGQKELEKTVKQLEKTTDGIVFTIAKIVETRDPYTSGHQKRVANLARAIAEEMGLPEEKIKGIYMAAVIHDIGKIYVPSEVLTKPSKLSKIEFEMIKLHPQYGYDILKDVNFPWPVALAILQHHERLDGSGYPQGLKGDELILEAKILAVADVVEAMSSHRPYRPALGIDKALEEIEKNRGKLYDLEVVNTCVRLLKKKGFNF